MALSRSLLKCVFFKAALSIIGLGIFCSLPAIGFCAPANDNFAGATQLTGSSGKATGTNEEATSEDNEPDHAYAASGMSVWWKWRPSTTGYYSFDTAGSTFDTVLAVYKGTTLANLTEMASNNDDGNIAPQSKVVFSAAANTWYYIAVDGYDSEQFGITLNWRTASPPANDNFAKATALTGSSGRATASTLDATDEADEENLSGFGGKSAWWSWTAPATGQYIVKLSTLGSTFNTTLAVYRGTAISNLVEEVSNDDAESGDTATSALTFLSEPRVKYYIAVDGYGGEAGSIVLDWSATYNNDNFADAIQLTGSAGQATGSNLYASSEINEPDPAGSSAYMSVWWKWTAPKSGDFAIDTHGSSFDTILSVYTGAGIGGLTAVAVNNDDGSANRNSGVTLRAQSGTTYYISVDGYNGETGEILLNWKEGTAATVLPGDLNGDGQITVADAVIALKVIAGIAPGSSLDLAARDVNGDRKIGLADLIHILQKAGGLR